MKDASAKTKDVLMLDNCIDKNKILGEQYEYDRGNKADCIIVPEENYFVKGEIKLVEGYVYL